MIAKDLVYGSTKCYPASVGLSCAFRQWRADSHCHFIHGYALEITATFEALELDARNWVVDFGSLKSFKGWLENTFDHKTIIAEDDPELDYFKQGHAKGVLDIVVLPAGGCEKFAEYLFGAADTWLIDNGYAPRVKLVKLEVREHMGNSAYVRRRN
jgi:6-pyruvoyltetrahydropterin/6-carboxytetrahydropterin synthase